MNSNFKKCEEINRSSIQHLLEEFCIYPRYIKGNEALYYAPYRKDTEASMGVNFSKNVWHDYGSNEGGTIIDLLQKLYATNDIKVVLYKYNNQDRSLYCTNALPKRTKTFINNAPKLTYQSTGRIINTQLINYLKSRGIHQSTWDHFLEEIELKKGMISQRAIGFKNDSNGYEIRSTKGKFCLGTKDITTIKRKDNEFILFEGFMDFLSFIELKKWKMQSVIILNSTANIESGIEAIRQLNFNKIEAYFDNDFAGKKAYSKLKSAFKQSVDRSDLYRQSKDLNEHLPRLQKQQSTLI